MWSLGAPESGQEITWAKDETVEEIKNLGLGFAKAVMASKKSKEELWEDNCLQFWCATLCFRDVQFYLYI